MHGFHNHLTVYRPMKIGTYIQAFAWKKRRTLAGKILLYCCFLPFEIHLLVLQRDKRGGETSKTLAASWLVSIILYNIWHTARHYKWQDFILNMGYVTKSFQGRMSGCYLFSMFSTQCLIQQLSDYCSYICAYVVSASLFCSPFNILFCISASAEDETINFHLFIIT